MEDTYGRLPTDVLKYICLTYVTPIITCKKTNKNYQIIIQTPFQTFTLRLATYGLPLHDLVSRITLLHEFSRDKKSLRLRTKHNLTKIKIGNIILIDSNCVSYTLSLTSLSSLISCFQQYKQILETLLEEERKKIIS